MPQVRHHDSVTSYRVAEAAAVLGVSDDTVRRWIEQGRLPATSGPGGRTVLVLKHGAEGATFVIDGVSDDRKTVAGPVVDVTGAGDA